MDSKAFFAKLDEIVNKDPGTVQGVDALTEANGFDSMAIMELIVFLDEDCNTEMTPEEITTLSSAQALFDKVFG